MWIDKLVKLFFEALVLAFFIGQRFREVVDALRDIVTEIDLLPIEIFSRTLSLFDGLKSHLEPDNRLQVLCQKRHIV